ncbi:MAG: hypothetical protein WA433_10035, partial [Desulfobaccales bacterium]
SIPLNVDISVPHFMPLKPSGSEPGLNSEDTSTAAMGQAIKRISNTRRLMILLAMMLTLLTGIMPHP